MSDSRYSKSRMFTKSRPNATRTWSSSTYIRKDQISDRWWYFDLVNCTQQTCFHYMFWNTVELYTEIMLLVIGVDKVDCLFKFVYTYCSLRVVQSPSSNTQHFGFREYFRYATNINDKWRKVTKGPERCNMLNDSSVKGKN